VYHKFFLVKSAVRPTKPSPKKRKRLRGLPAPMPTDYVGEKPEWEEFKQKGNKCVSTTSAAVPCKDPIPGYLEIDLSMTTKAINMDKKILLWHIQYTFKSI